MKNLKLLYHIPFIVYRLSSIVYQPSTINYQLSTRCVINCTTTVPFRLFTFSPFHLFAFLPIFLLTSFFLLLTSTAHSSPNGGFSPIFSPKENKIAFVSGTYHSPTNIWLSDIFSSSQEQITKFGAMEPNFSTDGRKIYFITQRNGGGEFSYFDLEKKLERKIKTALPFDAQMPTISPDKQRIAYLNISDKSRNLWIMNLDGSNREQITNNFWIRNIKFTPDSKKIAFLVGRTVGVGIWIKDIESGKLTSIYTGSHEDGKDGESIKSGFVGEPYISPNSKWLAFTTPILGESDYKIKLANIDSGEIKELPVKHCTGGTIAFSPDGKSIAYVHNQHHKFTIHTINTDGTKDDQLTPFHLQARNPVFSHDGKYVVFEAKEEGKSYLSEIWVADVQGKNLKKVTKSYPSYFGVKPYSKKKEIVYISDKNKILQMFTYNLNTKKEKIIETIKLENFIDYKLSFDEKYLLVVYRDRIRIADLNKNKISDLIRAKEILSAFFDKDKIIFNAVDEKMLPQVYRVDTKGKNLKRLSINKGNEMSLFPVFHKNKMYYIKREAIFKKSVNGNKENMVIDFSKQKKNTNEKILLSNLKISMDGKFLLFKVGRRVNDSLFAEIWLLKIRNRKLESLYKEGINTEFALFNNLLSSPPDFIPSKNEVIFTSDFEGIPNIYVIDINTKKIKKLAKEYSVLPYPSYDGETIYYTGITNNVENIYSLNRKTGKKKKVVLQ